MTTMIVDELGRIPMSPFLKVTLTRAAEYAAAQTHREVTLEHLLLSLAEDPEASVILKSSNVDISRLMSDVSGYLGRHEDRVDPESGPAASAISSELRKILEAAATAAQQSRRREINGAIVLAAIVGDGKSPAAHMLRAQGLTFEQAIQALQKVVSTPSGAAAASSDGGKPSVAPSEPAVSTKAESMEVPPSPAKKAPVEQQKADPPSEPLPDAPQEQGVVEDRSAKAGGSAPRSGQDTSLDEAVASIRRKKPGAVGSGISGSPVAGSTDTGAPNWQTVRPPPPTELQRQAETQKPSAPGPAQADQEAQAPLQPTWAPPSSSPPQPAPRRAPPPMAPPGSRGPLPVGAGPSPAGGPPQSPGAAGVPSPAAAPGRQPPWTGGAPQMRPPQADALDRLDARRPRASSNGQSVQGGRASVEAGQLQENLPQFPHRIAHVSRVADLHGVCHVVIVTSILGHGTFLALVGRTAHCVVASGDFHAIVLTAT